MYVDKETYLPLSTNNVSVTTFAEQPATEQSSSINKVVLWAANISATRSPSPG
jgi:hypothetical protein